MCGNNIMIASVAYHGNGMYRPGKSGGDSESTPDTKPVVWAATGRSGGICGKSEMKNKKTKSKKGAGGNEYDKKSSGKNAAGAVSFFKTPRLHHLSRRCAF